MSDDQKICLGAIVGAFGVHGEVRLKSFCANPLDIATYSPLRDPKGQEFHIKKLREIKGGFAARIPEIETREIAQSLRGTRLYANRDLFPELADEEYYQTDLMGLKVFDGTNTLIGRIKAVQNYGAGDLLEIDRSGGSVMVPFTREFVPLVDTSAGKVIIDPPIGLLD